MQEVFSYDIELHNSTMHSKLITSRQISTFTLAIALSCGAILVPALEVKSQLSHELEERERVWSKANDAFQKKQFALAMKNFGDFMEFEADVKSERFVEAVYLESICALNLYHKDAEFRIDEFITAYPESPYVIEALFAIADHHYKRRHYEKASEAFNKVDLRQLSTDKKRELQFKRGHSFFEKENFEAARYDLFDVMKSKGTFHSAATYYFSHIAI
jgi:TolA-binding protein